MKHNNNTRREVAPGLFLPNMSAPGTFRGSFSGKGVGSAGQTTGRLSHHKNNPARNKERAQQQKVLGKSQLLRTPDPTAEMNEDTDDSGDSSSEHDEVQPLSALGNSSTESESGTDTDQEEEDDDVDGNTGKELSTMSFEELIHLQSKVGKKQMYKTIRASRGKKPEGERVRPTNKQPLEISSKKPIPFLRKVVPAKKMMRRDPRFDDLSGAYKEDVFEKTYSFLNDIKKREKQVVEKKLQKTRNPDLKEKLEQLLRRMDQQEEAAQKKIKLREKQLEFKKQQRELAQQGKKPFYLKKGDIRKMELADKYQELKKKGKLEHFLSKKRKRNSNKDRRRLPNK
ncbi:ribosomal RNA processing protein 36 homolog isoform X2 [Pseudophryne corroboree]|uniref:ribosomal RNA processing protein 36 homolog isoform X2 n=1 Tax=Pseudophryne corroboree TaxID=495146 RepID=UPI003081294C